MKKQNNKVAYLFLMPSLLGVSIFVLIPFLDAFRRSFFSAMSGKFVGFQNYISIFQNEALKLATKNTVRFVCICIPILLVLSLIFAAVLVNLKQKSELIKTLFLVPMAIPIASVVLLWQIFFHKNGLFNVLILKLGGNSIDFMNTKMAFWVLVFSYIWKNLGYTMVLWLAGLMDISKELYEAAMVDGANKIKQFFYITLPCLLPTVFIATVLSLVNSFKVFREAYLISGNYPHESIYMLQHIFNNWFLNLDIQKMCATAVVMAGLMILFILVIQYLSNKGDANNG